jgi:hypothetical protein
MSLSKLTVYDMRKTRINFFAGADLHCCRLGSMGFGTRAIAEATGLSEGQVGYRLRLGQIKRSDYRNGKSAVAQKLLRYTKASLTPLIERQLVRALKAPPKPAKPVIDITPA